MSATGLSGMRQFEEREPQGVGSAFRDCIIVDGGSGAASQRLLMS